jgi:hypothetical protein
MSTLKSALLGLGICGVIGAGTTLANTLLPNFYAASDFDARMALIHNPFYVARQWVLMAHPFFTLMLMLGLALALWDRAPGRAAAAYSFAFVEKAIEFVLGATILFVVNDLWKTGYLAGGPEAADFRVKVQTFLDVIEGVYPVLWAMFMLSTGLVCSALKRSGLEGWVAATGALTVVITALMFVGDYLDQAWADPVVAWTYSPALTAHRLLAAIWLIGLSRRSP